MLMVRLMCERARVGFSLELLILSTALVTSTRKDHAMTSQAKTVEKSAGNVRVICRVLFPTATENEVKPSWVVIRTSSFVRLKQWFPTKH